MLETTANKKSYTGNGVVDTFVYDFLVLKSTHVFVYLDGVEYAGDITVLGIGNPAGGTVQLADIPADGVDVTIYRKVPLTQETDYQPYTDFPSEQVEKDLDLRAMAQQQLNEQLSRSLSASIGAAPDVDYTLPAPVANTVLGWDDTAKAFVNGPTFTQIASAEAAGAAAVAAASAASAAQVAAEAAASTIEAGYVPPRVILGLGALAQNQVFFTPYDDSVYLTDIVHNLYDNRFILFGGPTGIQAALAVSTEGLKDFVEISNPKNIALFCGVYTRVGATSIIILGGAYDGADAYMLRSTDGGTSFVEIAAPAGANSITKFCDSGNILLGVTVGNFGFNIIRSTDNGATWTKIAHPDDVGDTGTFYDIEYVGANTYLAYGYKNSGAGYLLRSTDGGLTWTEIAAQGFMYKIKMDPTVAGRAIGSGNLGDRVYETLDYGATWNEIIATYGQHSVAKDILVSGDMIIILSEFYAEMSVDSGLSWYRCSATRRGGTCFQNGSADIYTVYNNNLYYTNANAIWYLA